MGSGVITNITIDARGPVNLKLCGEGSNCGNAEVKVLRSENINPKIMFDDSGYSLDFEDRDVAFPKGGEYNNTIIGF